MSGLGPPRGPGPISGSGSAGPAPAGSGSGNGGTLRGLLFAGGCLSLPAQHFQPHNFGFGSGSHQGSGPCRPSQSSSESCSALPPATRNLTTAKGRSSQTIAQSQSQALLTQHKQLQFQTLTNSSASPAYTVGNVPVKPSQGTPLGSGLNCNLGKNSRPAASNHPSHPLPHRPASEHPAPNTSQPCVPTGANQQALVSNCQPPAPALSVKPAMITL
ncbi:hypothetical protein BKA70DRAFT_1449690 [Coprinopsis sp. MPI-PUGE-AT-0042]|nr:hypothetical protein BKA70DRAFT_1449690 [Coprinopsis sp. MPI-PUGE-AT-0042]